MQKVQPAKNNLNMDFLNGFNKPIGGTAVAAETAAETSSEPVIESVSVVESSSAETSGIEEEISIEDDLTSSKSIKTTQIVVRTTEKERDALKAYFTKHGVSLSKGLKIAVKYLEQQEQKGLVRFSDIGLY